MEERSNPSRTRWRRKKKEEAEDNGEMIKEHDGEVAYVIEGGKDNTERGRETISRTGRIGIL